MGSPCGHRAGRDVRGSEHRGARPSTFSAVSAGRVSASVCGYHRRCRARPDHLRSIRRANAGYSLWRGHQSNFRGASDRSGHRA